MDDQTQYPESTLLSILQGMSMSSSLRKLGVQFGFTPAYIHDMLHGRRGISTAMAKRMGYTRHDPPPYYTKD